MMPEMTAGGRKLKVNGGIGEYEFTAKLPKSKPNKDGLYESSYNAVINVPDPLDPSVMKPYKKKVTYFVSKPVIQVQSDAVSALYKDCGNPLNIQVPALGTLYSPSFKVSGAVKKNGKAGKGSIVVVPNQPKVSIAVSSGGNYIGTENFKVRLVPKPEMIAKLNSKKGKPVDQKRGMKAPGPRKIYMDAVPDNGFAKALPKDARFRTVKWTATLVRGKRPVGSPKTFTKPDGNLTAFAQKAKPGDRIMIEVKKVIRMNYLGKKLDVNVGTPIINIPLTD
jgi:gliding motility-associated protein GldM